MSSHPTRPPSCRPPRRKPRAAVVAAVPGVQTGSGPFPGMRPGGPLSGAVTQDARLAGRDLGAPYPGVGGRDPGCSPPPAPPRPRRGLGAPYTEGVTRDAPPPGALWEPHPRQRSGCTVPGGAVTRIPPLPRRRGLEALPRGGRAGAAPRPWAHCGHSLAPQTMGGRSPGLFGAAPPPASAPHLPAPHGCERRAAAPSTAPSPHVPA